MMRRKATQCPWRHFQVTGNGILEDPIYKRHLIVTRERLKAGVFFQKDVEKCPQIVKEYHYY